LTRVNVIPLRVIYLVERIGGARLMGTKYEIPELAGFLNLKRAALYVGVSRQRLFDMAGAGQLTTARRIVGDGRTVAIIIKTVELDRLKTRREAAKACPDCLAELARLNENGSKVTLADMVCEHIVLPPPSAEDELALSALGL
jgi:hypothetical protein